MGSSKLEKRKRNNRGSIKLSLLLVHWEYNGRTMQPFKQDATLEKKIIWAPAIVCIKAGFPVFWSFTSFLFLSLLW